jgi:hypothetical protein
MAQGVLPSNASTTLEQLALMVTTVQQQCNNSVAAV